jgi:hypothetical protein
MVPANGSSATTSPVAATATAAAADWLGGSKLDPAGQSQAAVAAAAATATKHAAAAKSLELFKGGLVKSGALCPRQIFRFVQQQVTGQHQRQQVGVKATAKGSPLHRHHHHHRHLPGALDDVIMLDSESPMFPSCMWSNMDDVCADPAIFEDDAYEKMCNNTNNSNDDTIGDNGSDNVGGAGGIRISGGISGTQIVSGVNPWGALGDGERQIEEVAAGEGVQSSASVQIPGGNDEWDIHSFGVDEEEEEEVPSSGGGGGGGGGSGGGGSFSLDGGRQLNVTLNPKP